MILIKDDFLEKEFSIYIDTCSLLSDYSEAFWNYILPYLRKYGQTVIVIPAVLNELIKHSENAENKELARKSQQVLCLLQSLEKESLACMGNWYDHTYADQDFITLFRSKSKKESVLLITQDKELAANVLALKEPNLSVRRILVDGSLSEIKLKEKASFWFMLCNKIVNFLFLSAEDRLSKQGVCKLCKKRMDTRYMKKGICATCLKKGTIHRCKRCGKKMLYPHYLRYVEKAKPFIYCDSCYLFRKQIYETRVCESCGNRFAITQGEVEFYKSKNWVLPKRCKNCRKQRK